MRFVSYATGGRHSVGLLRDEWTMCPVPGTESDEPTGMLHLIKNWSEMEDALADLDAPRVPLDSVELLAPIPLPRRNIFCVGKNYADHVREFGESGYDSTGDARSPEKPIFFTKAPSTVLAPGKVIDAHSTLTREVDYEAELAVIIGKGGRSITREAALKHVWGYTILNDVTARDLQRDHRQWFLGKSLDTFGPMGPWAVTADEVNEQALEISCSVNGELRQEAKTSALIFDIPTLIEVLSAGITLQPGDIIATGTPEGVGIGFTPPRFLEKGDEISIRITGLGTLRNSLG
jgi:2-keto-4-pentenoate hydratase/2-oxohepta-3-ene-1,7-dioic acid hydratase in catechol pathway